MSFVIEKLREFFRFGVQISTGRVGNKNGGRVFSTNTMWFEAIFIFTSLARDPPIGNDFVMDEYPFVYDGFEILLHRHWVDFLLSSVDDEVDVLVDLDPIPLSLHSVHGQVNVALHGDLAAGVKIQSDCSQFDFGTLHPCPLVPQNQHVRLWSR